MKTPTDEVLRVNSAALRALSRGDYYSAQQLFRDNVKQGRSFLTLHNLGEYYVEEGIALQSDPEGQRRHATRLGIQYLLKAESLKRSVVNLAATADAYLKVHAYQDAVSYFERSLEVANNQITDHRFYNNYGAALYLAGLCENAARRFHEALGYCKDHDDSYEMSVSYAYSLLPTDAAKCKEVTEGMILRLGEYEAQMLAMVFDCLIELGRVDEARDRLATQVERLKNSECDTRREIRSAQLALECPEYRKKLIAAYRYRPQTFKRCYYLG